MAIDIVEEQPTIEEVEPAITLQRNILVPGAGLACVVILFVVVS